MAVPPSRNLTGIRWAIDTNVIDAPGAATLRTLHSHGWIYLQRTDTMGTELSEHKGDLKRRDLFRAAEPFPEMLGPLVLGHSRLDHTVLGSDDDAKRLRGVFAILWPPPGYSFDKDGEAAELAGSEGRPLTRAEKRSRSRIRDAMHVATAIRYALDGFVTDDGSGHRRGILDSAEPIAAAFGGFRLQSVEDATKEARRRIAHVRRAASQYPFHTQNPEELPDWP